MPHRMAVTLPKLLPTRILNPRWTCKNGSEMSKHVMQQEALRPAAKRTSPSAKELREKEFLDAVERVYRRYQGDILAFYKDVQSDVQKRDSSHKHV